MHVPEANDRAFMYVAILEARESTLTDVQRNDAQRAGLAAARALEDERNRAYALAALAPQLSVEAKSEALGEALAAARAIEVEIFSRAGPNVAGFETLR